MTTKVEKSIRVNVPVAAVYNQWTQFEEFPKFMGGVQEVTQLDDTTIHWVAEIAGVKREWNASILEQVPNQKIAWAATEGATNAGAVYFDAVGSVETSVRLSLEYEPEGLVEKAGDRLNIVERQAEADLEKFKQFIESRGRETGAWTGSVNEGAGVGTPGLEAAQHSEGDSGKAGISAKAAAAGVAAAAAGVAAAGAAAKKSQTDSPDVEVETTTTNVTATPTTGEAATVYPTASEDYAADSVVDREVTVDPADDREANVDISPDAPGDDRGRTF